MSGVDEVERLRAELAEAKVNERRDREQINRLREENTQHMLNAESDVCTGCMQREQQRDAAWKTARQNGIKYEETKQAWHREQDRAKRAEAERDALKAAVERAKAEHTDYGDGSCEMCSNEDPTGLHEFRVMLPCPTLKALDGGA